jgi:hypothetical protein
MAGLGGGLTGYMVDLESTNGDCVPMDASHMYVVRDLDQSIFEVVSLS